MQNTLPQFPFDRYKNQPWCLVSRSLPRFRYIVLLHHPTNSTNCSQLLSPCPLNIRNYIFYLPYGQIPFVIRQMSVSDPLLADSNDKWALFRWDQAFGSVQSLHKVKSGRGKKKAIIVRKIVSLPDDSTGKCGHQNITNKQRESSMSGSSSSPSRLCFLGCSPLWHYLVCFFYSLNIPFIPFFMKVIISFLLKRL